MKKTILLSILIAFMACNKENLVLEVPKSEVDNDEVKVNIAITRVDSFGSTKATVKNAFADDDVVFVFFKGVAAPKYLEMKYNSSTDTWTSTAKNGLTSSDLSDAADKKMTAIYLPYGSTATVAASEGNFIFSDITYSGYFLKAELVDYTLVGGVLSGTLSMSAPALSSDSDKLIHFDISGFTSGHDYKLYQDYVKPLTFTSVLADGVLTLDEGTVGASIPGYEDGSMMSFSGILDASAVGNAVDYQFSIDDLTSSILYTRDAGTKTLSTSKYIGIGSINNSSVWNAFEYVDLGLSVRWALQNLDAVAPLYLGDYYAWAETSPKSNYNWNTYVWCDGTINTMKKYCDNSLMGYNDFVDNIYNIEPVDDVAYRNMGKGWHTPSMSEFEELFDNCDWTWTSENGIYGCLITSRVNGYNDRSIFLPASGNYTNSDLVNAGSIGYYWTNSLHEHSLSYYIYFNSSLFKKIDYEARGKGFSVRPVSSFNQSDISSFNIVTNTIELFNGDTYQLDYNMKDNNERIITVDNVKNDIIWSSSNPLIATVDNNGVVTAYSSGNVTINACYKGFNTSCSVAVIKHVKEAVDLGLSVKWATCNLGASSSEETGYYFSFGETEQFNMDGKYKWWIRRIDENSEIIKYCNLGEELEMEDDVAHVKWGAEWRMPTREEYEELVNNCNWIFTTINGRNGYLITSKIEGYKNNSIFLPVTGYYDWGGEKINYSGSFHDEEYGYYWTKQLLTADWWNANTYKAIAFHISSGSKTVTDMSRTNGLAVRPVCP